MFNVKPQIPTVLFAILTGTTTSVPAVASTLPTVIVVSGSAFTTVTNVLNTIHSDSSNAKIFLHFILFSFFLLF